MEMKNLIFHGTSTYDFFELLITDLSMAVQKFSQSLQDFQFECIGDAETDDEISIGEYYCSLIFCIILKVLLQILISLKSNRFTYPNTKHVKYSHFDKSVRAIFGCCREEYYKLPKT